MYAPPAFAVDDRAILADMLTRARLASLVVAGPQGFEAAHLPLLFDPDAGVLIGHLARGNPVAAADRQEALAVFTGPSAYVSPDFYPSKRAHGQVVPTWNYEAVHVHGRLERLEDPIELRRIVAALTDHFEAGRPAPWSIDDAPAPYIARMLDAITGVRLHVTRIEGVRKLSQNRSEADLAGVCAGLAASADAGDQAVARLMGGLSHD
jgi:transcriptional regulator